MNHSSDNLAEIEVIERRLTALTQPEARERLVAKGLARAMIWRGGTVPVGGPGYGKHLTAELLDHGYKLLTDALELRNAGRNTALVLTATRLAAESIESAVRRGDSSDENRGMHLVVAACAFHFARYAARSYCLIEGTWDLKLSSSERALVHLMRREFSEMEQHCFRWLNDIEHSDAVTAKHLADDGHESGLVDALATALDRNFYRALSVFSFALHNGGVEMFKEARELLSKGTRIAGSVNMVPQWWTHMLALHLLDELWQFSLHQKLPLLPEQDSDGAKWAELRWKYIAVLSSQTLAEVDLWPSQIEAASRAINPNDSLVVALPTSAGKTKIAELCILRALAGGGRVIYVTPLRALSAQLERSLSKTFRPLGFSVSSLYGASGVAEADIGTIREAQIVVATPEKLDFAIRQQPEVINDVSLIVLDEGHMIGLNPREIRYEVLVQRLLRRDDAGGRRLVCLSAIFSPGPAFDDFTAWIRGGQEGTPIQSKWRPTRQRFGVLSWDGVQGRLEFLGGEEPFVPKFLESQPPRGRRRRPYPADEKEVVLATAVRLVTDGHQVLVYCPLRASVESSAKTYLKMHRQGHAPSLLSDLERVQRAVAIGTEWLGADHVAVEALSVGLAVHHGALPRAFLTEVEELLSTKVLKIAFASPTLAQGLNLRCSALIFQSLHRGEPLIPAAEFANVCGRVGRAYVDLDGIIIHPILGDAGLRSWRKKKFVELIKSTEGRALESGLFQLIDLVANALSAKLQTDHATLMNYILNQDALWDLGMVESPETLADLDTAILSLVDDPNTSIDKLAESLDQMLESSLWKRRLARSEPQRAELQRAVLTGRARWIWKHSTPVQRRAYFAAGVGYAAGAFLTKNITELFSFLQAAETSFSVHKAEQAAAALVSLIERLVNIHPFSVKDTPLAWRQIARDWILGRSMGAIVKDHGDEETVQFVQEALVYRHVWAVEAVRVAAEAAGLDVSAIGGRCALALTFGSPHRASAVLLQAGLGSRVMSERLVRQFSLTFNDFDGLRDWLSRIPPGTWDNFWQTEPEREIWQKFRVGARGISGGEWTFERQSFPVLFDTGTSPKSASVRLISQNDQTFVCAPDFSRIGTIPSSPPPRLTGYVNARLVVPSSVTIDRYGPQRS